MARFTLNFAAVDNDRLPHYFARAAEMFAAARAQFLSDHFTLTLGIDGSASLDFSAADADPAPRPPDEAIVRGDVADSETVGDVFSELAKSGVIVQKKLVAGEPIQVIGEGAPDAWLEAVKQAAVKTAMRTKTARILEIGVGCGESTIILAKTCGEHARVYSSSPWRGLVDVVPAAKAFDLWSANVLGASADIHDRVSTASDYETLFTMDPQGCDLVVDAYGDSPRPAATHCKPGGIVLLRADSATMPQMLEFCRKYSLGDPVVDESGTAVAFIRKAEVLEPAQ